MDVCWAFRVSVQLHGSSRVGGNSAPLLPLESLLDPLAGLMARSPSVVELVVSHCCSTHKQQLLPQTQDAAGAGDEAAAAGAAGGVDPTALPESAALVADSKGGEETSVAAEGQAANGAAAAEGEVPAEGTDGTCVVPRQFYASSVFVGAKPGYLFGRGSKGLGYYYHNTSPEGQAVCSDRSFKEVLLLRWLPEEKRHCQQPHQRRAKRLLQQATRPPVAGATLVSVLIDHLQLVVNLHAATQPPPTTRPSVHPVDGVFELRSLETRGLRAGTLPKPCFPFALAADGILHILTQVTWLFPQLLPRVGRPLAPSAKALEGEASGSRSSLKGRPCVTHSSASSGSGKGESPLCQATEWQGRLSLSPAKLFLSERPPWAFVPASPCLYSANAESRVMQQLSSHSSFQASAANSSQPNLTPHLSSQPSGSKGSSGAAAEASSTSSQQRPVLELLMTLLLPRLLALASPPFAPARQSGFSWTAQSLKKGSAQSSLYQFSCLVDAAGSTNPDTRLALVRCVATLIRLLGGRAKSEGAQRRAETARLSSCGLESLAALSVGSFVDETDAAVLTTLLLRLLLSSQTPPANASSSSRSQTSLAGQPSGAGSDSPRTEEAAPSSPPEAQVQRREVRQQRSRETRAGRTGEGRREVTATSANDAGTSAGGALAQVSGSASSSSTALQSGKRLAASELNSSERQQLREVLCHLLLQLDLHGDRASFLASTIVRCLALLTQSPSASPAPSPGGERGDKGEREKTNADWRGASEWSSRPARRSEELAVDMSAEEDEISHDEDEDEDADFGEVEMLLGEADGDGDSEEVPSLDGEEEEDEGDEAPEDEEEAVARRSEDEEPDNAEADAEGGTAVDEEEDENISELDEEPLQLVEDEDADEDEEDEEDDDEDDDDDVIDSSNEDDEFGGKRRAPFFAASASMKKRSTGQGKREIQFLFAQTAATPKTRPTQTARVSSPTVVCLMSWKWIPRHLPCRCWKVRFA